MSEVELLKAEIAALKRKLDDRTEEVYQLALRLKRIEDPGFRPMTGLDLIGTDTARE